MEVDQEWWQWHASPSSSWCQWGRMDQWSPKEPISKIISRTTTTVYIVAAASYETSTGYQDLNCHLLLQQWSRILIWNWGQPNRYMLFKWKNNFSYVHCELNDPVLYVCMANYNCNNNGPNKEPFLLMNDSFMGTLILGDQFKNPHLLSSWCKKEWHHTHKLCTQLGIFP